MNIKTAYLFSYATPILNMSATRETNYKTGIIFIAQQANPTTRAGNTRITILDIHMYTVQGISKCNLQTNGLKQIFLKKLSF